MSNVSSPVKGYVSSKYGWRILSGSRVFHAGLDIATGGKPGNVHAMYAGTVERVVKNRKPGNRVTDSYAPGRTPNYVSVRNPDGELQFYGHTFASVTPGQKVVAGQKIGVTDLSGNTTGYHCHFECWDSRNKTRDPMIDFRKHGITPGSAPKISNVGKDWFSMATQNDLKKVLMDPDVLKAIAREVWNYDIVMSAADQKRTGQRSTNSGTLLRYASTALEVRNDR